MWILDRMEDGKAVLLDEENRSLLVPLQQLCEDCREGDVVEQNARKIWQPNPELTAMEREKTNQLLKLLNRQQRDCF